MVDVTRPQINDTYQGLPASYSKPAKVAIMSEDDSVFRMRSSKHHTIVGTDEISPSRVDDVASSLPQKAYYFGMQILVGEESKINQPQAGISAAMTTSFSRKRAA
jgi:hypothetical protein